LKNLKILPSVLQLSLLTGLLVSFFSNYPSSMLFVFSVTVMFLFLFLFFCF
jgi:hypothetical protein